MDHQPAEIPKEASNHFGSKLEPFVEAVVRSDFSKLFAEQMSRRKHFEVVLVKTFDVRGKGWAARRFINQTLNQFSHTILKRRSESKRPLSMKAEGVRFFPCKESQLDSFSRVINKN